MNCRLCSFASDTNPCTGCRRQAARLGITPSKLLEYARLQRVSHDDVLLKVAIEKGLLDEELYPVPLTRRVRLDYDRLLNMRAQGMLHKEIAKIFGVTPTAITKAIKRRTPILAAVKKERA